VELLEKRIAELERNSRTSSKPPSTDKGNFTKPRKPKSTRKKKRQKTRRTKGPSRLSLGSGGKSRSHQTSRLLSRSHLQWLWHPADAVF
jgi:hypothetical protein